MVTVTDLLNYDREPGGGVIAATSRQTRLKAERESCASC
jgi:hypothetical protein